MRLGGYHAEVRGVRGNWKMEVIWHVGVQSHMFNNVVEEIGLDPEELCVSCREFGLYLLDSGIH